MLSRTGLMQLMSQEEWRAGERLAAAGELRELRRGEGFVEYMVDEQPYALVRLNAAKPSTCDCGHMPCRHLAAAYIMAEESDAMKELNAYSLQHMSRALFDAVESIVPRVPTLLVEPSLFIDGTSLRMGLRVGEERLYAVRNVPQFLGILHEQGSYELAGGLSIRLRWQDMAPQAVVLLRALWAQCQTYRQVGQHLTAAQARNLPLSSEIAPQALRALSAMRFRLTVDGKTQIQTGIQQAGLPALFHVSGGLRGLWVRAQMEEPCQLVTMDGGYTLLSGRLTRVPRADRPLARLLLSREEQAYFFAPDELPRVTSELLPTLMRRHAVVLDDQLQQRMVRKPLQRRIYLDQHGREISARVRFIYGDMELDPFSVQEAPQLVLHDAQGEQEVLEAMAEAGFRVRKGYVVLAGEERIYRFLTQGVQRLNEVAQLFLSNDFKRLTPRAAALSGALRAQTGGLSIRLTEDGQPVEELVPLLMAIRGRKQYFRYKDGSYITLEGSEAWRDLAQAALEAVKDQRDPGELQGYRAAYLKALVERANLPIELDEGAKQLADPMDEQVESPVKGLHPYQLRGFRWIVSLDRLGMGGILADEMGLGKTVQTIAAIEHARQHAAQRLPSIVVVPTTLGYNWLSEFKRFAPKLKVQLCHGTRAQRQAIIQRFQGDSAPDVLVTSYPLIRQDIDLLKDIPFHYAVLDEAQFVKNALSLSARAVKKLQARTRLALSGTPMENNVAELWSLFDFILPGYLPPIRDFLRRYDQGRNARDLLLRIRPFLMRRLKSEVMAELPEKIESVVRVTMPEDQRQVYRAVLNQRRMRLEGLLQHSQLTLGRGEVLSALMELRQICCHPQLVLPGYTGDSGKMGLLSDILPEAIEGGNRVLIFSQFTKMLKILQQRLNREGIKTLYLDGETDPKERQRLTERFNEGSEPVFLISLKAGGTGLNLTGANMVIHYDPWWNPSAEDQAADRAHRLGQKRTVQVLRLVMHDSIEEQVLALGAQKRKMFEKLITPGEQMPGKLSGEDVLKLFGNGTGE